MLVTVWEAMYAAIPRLQAEEQLAAYAVAITATRAQDERELRERQSVVEGWRKQMQGAFDRMRSTARRVSLVQLRDILRGAFEEQVRE